MMDTEVVRVGFIGAGDICRDRHLPGLAKIEGVQVVAVCNRSRASGQKIADEFGIAHVEDDWRALLARDDVDAVFIGTWPYMHCEMSVATLGAGKHCFCQARMAMDLAEAQQMLAAAQGRSGLVNMICPPPTRMPFEAYIREQVQSGGLGQITLVELVSVNGSNLGRDSVHWREQRNLSGNQIMAVGIYAETLNSFVGPYDELSAQTATPIATKTGESGQQVAIDVPQTVTITGRLENGALAVEHHLGVAVDQSTPSDRLTIWGLQGTLRYEFGDTIAVAPAGQPLKPVEVPQSQQRGWCVEQDFIDAVRTARQGKPWSVSPDFAEGIDYMRKVEAVHQSAKTGQTVKLSQL